MFLNRSCRKIVKIWWKDNPMSRRGFERRRYFIFQDISTFPSETYWNPHSGNAAEVGTQFWTRNLLRHWCSPSCCLSWDRRVRTRVHKSPFLDPSRVTWNRVIHSHPILRSILILSCYPFLGLPCGFIPSMFWSKSCSYYCHSCHIIPISSTLIWS
jgi:hypothetical protein